MPKIFQTKVQSNRVGRKNRDLVVSVEQKKILKLSESALTAQCFQWAWNQYPKTRRCLFHIPNEGKRSMIYAAQQKAMGLISGVPDFCFVCNGFAYFAELKTDNGKLDAAQIEIHKVWSEQKINVAIIRSLDEFMIWFKNCLQLKTNDKEK